LALRSSRCKIAMYVSVISEGSMARMIRKQVYLESKQEQKLRRLADRWGCSEAEVLRKAIDRIMEAEGEFLERLEAAGLLVPPREDKDLDDGESLELSRITSVEVASAFHRKVREGRFDLQARTQAWRIYRRHSRERFCAPEPDEATYRLAEDLLFAER